MIQCNNKTITHIYKGESPKLPDEYQEVEYIHGTGEQYINTGYAANANIEINFKYKSDFIVFPSSSRTRCIIGGRKTASDGISMWERDGNYQYGKNTSQFLEVKQAIENTDIHTVKIDKGGDLYVDETKILTYTAGTSFQPGSYIYLFTTLSATNAGWTRRTDNTDNRTMIGQFYHCIIRDNGVTVRHLIPCYRRSDNEPGMYDLVNGVFYTNAGTGSFTVGSDVVYKKVALITDNDGEIVHCDLPAEYTRCEYLQSNGNQYIDSGIECWSDYGMAFKTRMATNVNSACCGGILKVNDAPPTYYRYHYSPYNSSATTILNLWYQEDSNINSSIAFTNFNQLETHTITVKPQEGKAVAKQSTNTSTKSFTAISPRISTGHNIYIFGRLNVDGITVQTRASTFYYFRIFNGGTLLRNLIPCIRVSDSKPGMYDFVSKTFLTNIGTGEFGYKVCDTGVVVNPT